MNSRLANSAYGRLGSLTLLIPAFRRCTLPCRLRRKEPAMAHAKDKGASKNVKKKAQKSVKEKRVEKKMKKDARERTLGE
jgi:hypothetical protein